MKLRDLFKAFCYHDHELSCHELTDEECQDAVKRVDELLLLKSITGSSGSDPAVNKTPSEIKEAL